MPYQLLVGIDWSTSSHQVCVLNPEGVILREIAVEHRAAEITSFIDFLVREAGGDPGGIAVGIERPRGSLVEALLERGLHVYSLFPLVASFLFSVLVVVSQPHLTPRSGATQVSTKNRTPSFRRVEVDDPLVVQIRELSRVNEDLRGEVNRLTNRLRDQVHRAAPHLLQLCPSANEPWFWELVEHVIGPQPWGRFQRRSVEQLLKRFRIRRVDADAVLKVLREPPMSLGPGAAEAASTHIALLLPRLRVAHEQTKLCCKQLDALLDELSDQHDDDDGPSDLQILRSLPGVGSIILGTLLAEAAPLLAQRDAATLRSYGGPAPITRRSGKSWVVVMRRGCNERLRNAFYHWARVSSICDPDTRSYDADLRSRGHTHGRALRSVSDRWIRVLMAMLRNRTLYLADPAKEASPTP